MTHLASGWGILWQTDRSKMIAWRWIRGGNTVGKGGERRGPRNATPHPWGPAPLSKRRPHPVPSQSVTFLPLCSPILRASVGASGGGSLKSDDTVTGYHLTCNMTQVKLKQPAGRVLGPTPGVPGWFLDLSVLPAKPGPPFCTCLLTGAS